MLKVGLTGGIGCGKSTAVDAFRVFGIPIIDADLISKQMVEQGSEALGEIAEAFGDDILLDNGELNRSLLKEKIFSGTSTTSNHNKKNVTLDTLEAILHPRIQSEILSQISRIENQTTSPAYVIVDIPLLIEKNYQSLFDRIIVVDCLPEQQLERVNNRDGMPVSSIKNVMDAQADRKIRLKSATDILDNTADVDKLLSQIKSLHSKFTD
jgi:dephospho-CoA kinase